MMTMYKLWLYLAYGIHGRHWTFKGRPIIRRGGAGSRISIGDYFTAISRSIDNAIGVQQPVIIRTVSPGAEVTIGSQVGISGATVSAAKSITIGDRVVIGSGALVMDSDLHPTDSGERAAHPESKGIARPVVIEDDVFIGARAIVLKGVTVGKGAVVGAGAVVTRDVPPKSIVAGNPAKIIGNTGR